MGRNRRKKDEPFNPFARDASAQRNKRMSERSQNQRRNAPNELAKRRQEALDRLGTQDEKQTPKYDDENAKKILEMIERLGIPPFKRDYKRRFEELMYGSTITGKISQENPQNSSREDRMKELRRKSEESRKNAKSQRKDGVQVQSEVQVPADIRKKKKTHTAFHPWQTRAAVGYSPGNQRPKSKKKKSKTSSKEKQRIVQKSNTGSPSLRNRNAVDFDYDHRLKIIAKERGKLEKMQDRDKQRSQTSKINNLQSIHDQMFRLKDGKGKNNAKIIQNLKKDFEKEAS